MSEDNFSRDIGELTGEIKVLTSAIGNLSKEFSDFKNGIGPRVETHGKILAAVEANRVNDKEYLDAVDNKINKHVDGHWRWIGVMIGILTLGGVIVTWMRTRI